MYLYEVCSNMTDRLAAACKERNVKLIQEGYCLILKGQLEELAKLHKEFFFTFTFDPIPVKN